MLKMYNEGSADQKQLFLLGENLRTHYGSLSADNRKIKFERLMREIPNETKRRMLAKEMVRILEMRSQMVNDEKQTNLKEVLMKLV
jgi:hypothetical protein